MSRSKKISLIVLLAVLAVCCIVTFAISRHEERQEQIRNSDEVVLALDYDSITALSWEYDETSLAFHKDGSWNWDEDEAFPVDEEKIRGLLEQFGEFAVTFAIDDVEDYAQYGLDEPVCTICITADGQEYTIELGAYSTMDEERYVSVGDGRVFLVEHDPMEDYELEISDMILNDVIPDLSGATAISFTGAVNYSVYYEEESADTYCASDLYFTDGLPLETANVTSWLNTADGLSLSEYASYNVSGEELAAFGLDEPELSFTVDYTIEAEDEESEPETGSFTMSVGRNQEELAAAEAAEAENAEAEAAAEETGEEAETVEVPAVTAYVRVGDSQIVYVIDSDTYEALTAVSYDDLRHDEVFTASFDDVYQLDITVDGETYTLTTAPESEEEDAALLWYYGEEEIDTASLEKALNALKADSFTDTPADGKEEISLTVSLNNENWPEISLAFYRFDGTDCLAVVDGTPVSLVPRSEVVDLIEAVNAIVLNG